MSEKRTQPNYLSPPASLLVKLGSIIVHFDEYYAAGGHPFDLQTAQQLLLDPEVQTWIIEMTSRAMLPVKRSSPASRPNRGEVE